MSTLTVRGLLNPATVEINDEAYELKSEALGVSRILDVVTTPAQQDYAVAALRDIKSLIKRIETARVEIKAPVLKLGKDIDHAAQTFTAELLAEERRLTGLVSGYQSEQLRIAREAEAKRIAELQRIENERLKAEAEVRRQADEAIRKAKTLEAAEAAAKAEQERLARAAQSAQVAASQVIAAPVVARAEGMAVRSAPKFRVTDIRSLAFARPDLVRIEPNAEAINREIRAGNLNITGLECWMETVAGVRV